MKNNIFWNIYTNLEREVLNLADVIYFTDAQSSVYSVRISDLLIRCNVEIESLIKELYNKNSYEKNKNKTGDMLTELNKDWNLERKKVSIISTNMNFTKKYSSFCPFHYQKKDDNDFYSAYNAIKHDRANNFKKYATIHYLLRALAGLYLLNLYYREEVFNNLKNNYKLDQCLGSKIFSFHTKILTPKYPIKEQALKTVDELEALYIIKPTVKTYTEYYKEFNIIKPKLLEILKSKGFKPEKNESNEELDLSYSEIYKKAIKIGADIGDAEIFKKLVELETPATKKQDAMIYEGKISMSCKIDYLN